MYEKWEKACTTIRTLTSLRYLVVGMMLRNRYDHESVEPEVFLRIFSPLASLETGSIEMEINVDISEVVKGMLDLAKFKLEYRHRPHDGRICVQF
jgi:hypothetical protein